MPRKKSGVSKSRKSYFKRYYKKNLETYALRSLQHYYNLTLNQAKKILDLRKIGVCAICNKKPNPQATGPNSVLHVDHDHSTGKIRGLICNHCNRALGAFYDSLDLMKAAQNYLNSPPGLESYINTRKSKSKIPVLLFLILSKMLHISMFLGSFGFLGV